MRLIGIANKVIIVDFCNSFLAQPTSFFIIHILQGFGRFKHISIVVENVLQVVVHLRH
jgi:hypothetical protein